MRGESLTGGGRAAKAVVVRLLVGLVCVVSFLQVVQILLLGRGQHLGHDAGVLPLRQAYQSCAQFTLSTLYTRQEPWPHTYFTRPFNIKTNNGRVANCMLLFTNLLIYWCMAVYTRCPKLHDCTVVLLFLCLNKYLTHKHGSEVLYLSISHHFVFSLSNFDSMKAL